MVCSVTIQYWTSGGQGMMLQESETTADEQFLKVMSVRNRKTSNKPDTGPERRIWLCSWSIYCLIRRSGPSGRVSWSWVMDSEVWVLGLLVCLLFMFCFCFSSSILKSTDYLFFWNFLVFSFWIYGLWFVDLQPHGIKLVFSLICCLFLPMYLGYFPCKVWEWDAVKKHFLRRGNREERLPNYTRTELRIRDNWCYKVRAYCNNILEENRTKWSKRTCLCFESLTKKPGEVFLKTSKEIGRKLPKRVQAVLINKVHHTKYWLLFMLGLYKLSLPHVLCLYKEKKWLL